MKDNKLEIGDVLYTTSSNYSNGGSIKKNTVNRLTSTQAHCDTGLKFRIQVYKHHSSDSYSTHQIGIEYASGTLANDKLNEKFELQKSKRTVSHNLDTIKTWDLTLEECNEIISVFDKLQTVRQAKINGQ